MTRLSHRAPAATPSRRIPPLPHPSWSRDTAAQAKDGQRIAPEEFWSRLGL